MSEPLTILGRGDSWETCPFKGEIWACATCLITEGMEDFHYDKVFAIDDENESEPVREAIKVARKKRIPIVSTKPYCDERYPLFEVMTTFKTSYLRTTVSCMLALAIHQNRNPLEIFGVDQTGDYLRGKPFVTFWLGVATGRGIKYTIHTKSLMPQRIEMRKKEEILAGCNIVR